MKCSLSSEDFQFRNDQNDLFSQEAVVTGRYHTITYKELSSNLDETS